MSHARRAAINVFIAFHLAAITCWALPPDALLDRIRQAIAPYMLWTGLFQTWDMFAPVPKNVNERLEAAVVLLDGHVKTWRPPDPQAMPFFARYESERYRKFAEQVCNESNAPLWPDVARHIARQFRDRGNPPSFVILIRYRTEIPQPGSKTAGLPKEPGHILFEYSVAAKDLE